MVKKRNVDNEELVNFLEKTENDGWINKYGHEGPSLFLLHLFGSSSLLRQPNLPHRSKLLEPSNSSPCISRGSVEVIRPSSLHHSLHRALLFRIRQSGKHVGPARNPPSLFGG